MKLLFSGICLVLLLVFGCQSGKVTVEKALKSEQSDTSNYSINITYPKISGPGAKKINGLITASYEQNIAEFKEFIEDFEPESQRQLTGDFKVHFNETPFLSIEQQFEWAVPGTSILLIEFSNFNFQTKEKKDHSITDILVDDPGAKSQLFNIVKEVWRSGNEDLPCDLDEGDPLEDFVVTGEEVLFYVNLYTGNPICQWEVIRVNLEEIGHLLNPELKRFFSFNDN